jgi:asparagine N-glycosylation enzyme membrane subunit Stt3
MNKRIIIAITIIAVVVIAVVSYYGLTMKSRELPISVDYVGGRYNVTLSLFRDGHSEIKYEDETGNHSEMYFESQMRTGLDWIRNNTPENAIFLCWWDYGHSIKGYAERNVIARNPSHEWIEMVAIARTDPGAIKEFDSNEKVVDVAKALATSNSTETSQIMEKYDAAYIVVYKDDLLKAPWMYKVAGLDPMNYQVQLQNSTWVLNETGKQTMISRLLDNRDTGFTLVYQDASMKVYKID